MARFHGAVGYGVAAETADGVWEDSVSERTYFGDAVQTFRRLNEGESVTGNITPGGTYISIVADPYAFEHFFAIRYVSWMGALWTVTNVEVRSPRLVLWLGEVYRGPKV